MTDTVITTQYRSTEDLSAEDVRAFEESYEDGIESNLASHKSQLAAMSLKAANSSEDLTATDIAILKDLGKDLTWADLQNMVPSIIDNDSAELLLAVSTLANSDIGTQENPGVPLTDEEIASAVNRLYNDTSSNDRVFLLNNFKNQGAYGRIFNVDQTNGQDQFSYTLTDAAGSVIDLPTTAEIDRAIIFLTAASYPTDDNGDMVEGSPVAFVNWDFDTSEDEIMARLGRLDSYDNFSPDYWQNMISAITTSGEIAATGGTGYVDTPPITDADELTALEEQLSEYEDNYAIASALISELGTNRHTNGYDSKTLAVTIDGEVQSKSLKTWLTQIGIMQPNHDDNDDYAQSELDALLVNLENYQNLQSMGQTVVAAEKNGMSADNLAQMKKEFYEYQNAVEFCNVMSCAQSDYHYRGGVDFDNETNKDADERRFVTVMHYVNPETGETSNISTKDYMQNHADGLIYADNSSDALDSGQFDDGDMHLDSNELDRMFLISRGYMETQRNEVSKAIYAEKQGMEGFDEAMSDYTDAIELKADWEACIAALDASAEQKKGSVDATDIKFQSGVDENGDPVWVVCSDFLADHDEGADNYDDNTNFSRTEINHLRDWFNYGDSANEDWRSQTNLGYAHTLDIDIAAKAAVLDGLTPPAEQVRDTDVHGNATVVVDVTTVMGDAEWDAIIDGDVDTPDEDGNVWSDSSVRTLIDNPFDDPQLDDIEDTTDEDFTVDPDGTIRNEDGEAVLTYDQLVEAYDPAGNALLDSLGISDGDIVDIGMVMYVVMADRMSMLGEKIMEITREQAKNTNAQADVNAMVACLNSGGDVNADTAEVTLSDGTVTTLAAAMQIYGYNDFVGGDHNLSAEEASQQAENIKAKGDGLGREGQIIMNELTQLSQKYQQAVTEMMNFLEKTDALKQKILDKIGR